MIQAFKIQKCGFLSADGQIDGKTYARLQSVVASRPARIKKLKAPAAVNLKGLPNRAIRMNKVGEIVCVLHRASAHFGYPIAQSESEAQLFGVTTRAAVIAYQWARQLSTTGHLEGETLAVLRSEILRVSLQANAGRPTHRVRGSGRDKCWKGKSDITARYSRRHRTARNC